MLGKLSAKVALSTVLAAGATLLFSQTSFAQSAHTGKISVYHLNSDFKGRGSCIQMNPALPGNVIWACVWQGHLYNEFNNLFREAYFQGRTCTVWWSTHDPNQLLLVELAQCE